MRPIKVITVDDNQKFLQFINNVISNEKDIEVIGVAMDGEEAIEKTKELKPDIVLMDIRMPVINGIKATSRIKQMMPEVKVIILTIFDIDEYREAALASGASDYIIKKSMQKEIIPAIYEAHKDL